MNNLINCVEAILLRSGRPVKISEIRELIRLMDQQAELADIKKAIIDLDKRFTKGSRDIGKTAIAKDKVIQRIINKASAAALRCVEISSGSPLTEKELNATKKSEINRECPSIANPNYIPY